MPELGKCPACGGGVALSTPRCPQCGESKFEELGRVLERRQCQTCGGDGKGTWDNSSFSGHWQCTDYGSMCHGRGYYLIYEVIDVRNGKPCRQLSDHEYGLFRTGNSKFVQVEIQHPGTKPKPSEPLFTPGCVLAISIALAVIALLIGCLVGMVIAIREFVHGIF